MDLQALQQMMMGGGQNALSRLVGMGMPRPGGADSNAGCKPWEGLHKLDDITKAELGQMLSRLQTNESRPMSELTVLLLGRPGAGKTSTMNSIFNETASPVAAFRTMPTEVEVISRVSNGFTLTVIDTPGLTGQDEVSGASLHAIKEVLKDKSVDIVLYVDRLDGYRTSSLDLATVKAVTSTFGRDIWNNTILCLTHAGLENLPGERRAEEPPPAPRPRAAAPPRPRAAAPPRRPCHASSPPGAHADRPPHPPEPAAKGKWDEHVERRSRQVQDLIRRGGGFKDMPVALVENNRGLLNAHGELPDESLWMVDLVDMMVQAVENGVEAYQLDLAAEKDSNPNRRRKWLIPALLLAQVAFKLFVIDRMIEDDGCTGDQYGPFDEDTVRANRKQLAADKQARGEEGSESESDSESDADEAGSGSDDDASGDDSGDDSGDSGDDSDEE